MDYTDLGGSDLTVSRIALGCMGLRRADARRSGGSWLFRRAITEQIDGSRSVGRSTAPTSPLPSSASPPQPPSTGPRRR
jgi:hypothetical protein